MKRYVPIKYTVLMAFLFFIIPVLSAITLLTAFEISRPVIWACVCSIGLIFVGPVIYTQNLKCSSIAIDSHTVTNYISDGTRNFGWTEEIRKIRSIKLVSREEVREHFPNCNCRTALLIDFGAYNMKYISMDFFSERQIQKIIEHLAAKK